MKNNTINISNKYVAFNGALLFVSVVLAYSLIIMIYVLIRTSLTIYDIMPNGERTSILWQNGISVIYAVSIFSILVTIISAIVGGFTSVILKKMLAYFNIQFKNKRTFFISFITAFLMIVIVYSILYLLLSDWMTFDNLEPFLFWFLIPSTIFLISTLIGGYNLNKILKIIIVSKNDNKTCNYKNNS